MNDLDLIQWPAMLATVIAAWLVASQSKRRREFGFWCFLIDHAYALIALQVALAALNIRGAYKNEPDPSAATPKP